MTKNNFGVPLIFTIFNKTVKYGSYLKILFKFDDAKYRGGKIGLICSLNDLNRQVQTNHYIKG